MKKLLSLALAVLMLVSCGCASVPTEQTEEDAYIADIQDNADLINLAASEHKEVRVTPSDKAYVRAGKWASMNWREINQKEGLDTNNEEVLVLKKTSADYLREILLEFDLTEISKLAFKKVFFIPSFTQTDSAAHTVTIYRLDPDSWDGETVTYNTRPAFKEVIVKNTPVSGMMAVDLTDAVVDAIAMGETKISIGIAGDVTTASEDKVNPKTTTLVATTGDAVNSYIYELVEDEAENKAIWDWAQKLFNEWFDRYIELRNQPLNEDAKLIVSDADEFNKIVYSSGSGFGNWSLSNVNKEYATRTYEALDDLGDYTDYENNYEQDIYGGWMNPSMRQESTGYFYAKKIDGRWWFIDPLGYPCIVRTISGPTIAYLSSPNQKAAALAKYGTQEKWQIATIRWLKDDVGFNAARGLYSVEEPTITEDSIGGMASGYGSRIGTNCSNGGSTRFSENNTMNVFDPGFVDYCDEKANSGLSAEVNNPWITGYTTDNELPMDVNMLYNYMQIDYTKEVNYYSYAATWTWLINMTGNENPSAADVDSEMLELFRGFVYDRYFNVVDAAFEKYDSNHMNLGCRFLTHVKNAEWVLRFASLYLDAMTINWYGDWTPNAEDIYEIARQADLPLEVTEFYTKGLENDGSFDDPSDPLKNTRGAGWVVRTQQDRGDFYENFTLRLIESGVFVSWQWHQYIDDDDSPEVIYTGGKPDATGKNWRDQSNIDANKGIVNNWHEPYEELCESMAQINFNVYRLALHFDAKYAARAAE